MSNTCYDIQSRVLNLSLTEWSVEDFFTLLSRRVMLYLAADMRSSIAQTNLNTRNGDDAQKVLKLLHYQPNIIS